MLVGLGLGAATGALAVARAGGSAGAAADRLNEAGRALEPATRIPPTTTTTTVPEDGSGDDPGNDPDPVDRSRYDDYDPAEIEPLAAGRVRFPILVAENDTCFVGDNFGACRSGCSRSHEGVDIMADRGLAVIAVVDGTLTKKYEDSGSCGGAGHGWTLNDEANDVVYKFFHLDSHADGLEEGDSVVEGQIIGYIGETGTSGVCSDQYSNYHLHFEYRPGNTAQDSFDLLQQPEHVRFAD